MLDKRVWRINLKMIGFDFTVIYSTSKLDLISSQAACKNLHICCRRKTDKQNQATYSWEEILQLINSNNMALIPAAVTPHGHTIPLFNRLLYGSGVEPHTTFKNKPHTQQCERIARSTSVPHGILPRANHLWKFNNPTKSYGGTYKAIDPQSYFNQDLGVVMSTAVSSHLLRADDKISNFKPTPCSETKGCRCDPDNSDCMYGPTSSNDGLSFCANAELSDLSQTHHTRWCGTKMIPFQDTLSEHFSCVRGHPFGVTLPASGRLSTDAYVVAGSN